MLSVPICYHCTFLCSAFPHSHLSLNGQRKAPLTHPWSMPNPSPTFLQFNSLSSCILPSSTSWPITSICCCSRPRPQHTHCSVSNFSTLPCPFQRRIWFIDQDCDASKDPELMSAESMPNPVLPQSLCPTQSPPWLPPVLPEPSAIPWEEPHVPINPQQ